ncbi:MAG TPA: hypothetical protein VGJ48_25015, partial [Pyrinomonadaceae bacterium]
MTRVSESMRRALRKSPGTIRKLLSLALLLFTGLYSLITLSWVSGELVYAQENSRPNVPIQRTEVAKWR